MSDGTTLVLVLARRGAARPPPRDRPRPPRRGHDAPRLDRAARAATPPKLGLAWGAGHATTLFALGLPIVLYSAYLPEAVQRGAETAIGFLIVGLAVWLLVRWRRGAFHVHVHDHDDRSHAHLHSHASRGRTTHARSSARRSARFGDRPPARNRRQRRRRRSCSSRRSTAKALAVAALGDPRGVHRGLDDAAHDRLRARRSARQLARPPRPRARRGQPRVRHLVRAGRAESPPYYF